MKNEYIHVRCDKKTKEQVNKILKELGMNMSKAIDIYLREIIRTKSIPFRIKLK